MDQRSPQIVDPAPFRVLNAAGPANVVVTCDHASHATPAQLHRLGLDEATITRHIGWDIGAADIATYLSKRLDAVAVLSGVSRLVIDCNRHLDDPTSIPAVSDGVVIPGNEGIDGDERERRQEQWFWPYHAQLDEIVRDRIDRGHAPVILSVHTMTHRMRGQDRPWQIALSSHDDRRLTDPVLVALRAVEVLTVGDNEPYALDPREDFSTPRHALRFGLPHVQVEFRQDIVSTRPGAERYAEIFAAAFIDGLRALRRDGRGWPIV
ncbi:MAG: N-formylglutamate amidohydrolase [Hyphomicrobiales bacterium]